MALICPLCQNGISAFRVSSVFSCPRCHGALHSNYKRVASMAVAFGIVAELALLIFCQIHLGSTLVAIFAYGHYALIIGFFIYWAAVLSFVKLRSPE